MGYISPAGSRFTVLVWINNDTMFHVAGDNDDDDNCSSELQWTVSDNVEAQHHLSHMPRVKMFTQCLSSQLT